MSDAATVLGTKIAAWEKSLAYMQAHMQSAQALVEANPSFANSPLDYASVVERGQRWLDYAKQAKASGNPAAIRAALDTSLHGADPSRLNASRHALTNVVQQVAPVAESTAAEVAPIAESTTGGIVEAIAAEAPAFEPMVAAVEENAPVIVPLAVAGGTAAATSGGGAAAAAGGFLAGLSLPVVAAAVAAIAIIGGGIYVATHRNPSGTGTTVAAVATVPDAFATPSTVSPSELPVLTAPATTVAPDTTVSPPTTSAGIVPPFEQGTIPGQGTLAPGTTSPPGNNSVPPTTARQSGGTVRVKVVTTESCQDGGTASLRPGATVSFKGVGVTTGSDGTTANSGPAAIPAGVDTIHGNGTVLSIQVSVAKTGTGTHLLGNDQSYNFDPASASSSLPDDYVVAVRFRASGC